MTSPVQFHYLVDNFHLNILLLPQKLIWVQKLGREYVVKHVGFGVKLSGFTSNFVPLLSWVTLGRLTNFCQPQFSHLQMGIMTVFTLQGYLED